MKHLRGFGLFCGFVLFAAACASAPTRYYTLSASPAPGAEAAAPCLSVVVGPVTVPESVDRPQFVLRKSTHEVTIDELNCWASSLQNQIAGVVARNLEVRLGTPSVTLSSEGGGNRTGYRVRIDVQRFESVPGDTATLDGIWTVRRTRDEATRIGRTTVTEPVQGESYDALATAHSRCVDRLSRDIAEAIDSLEHRNHP